MATRRKSKGAYMISAVAEMYEIHPQTLRMYEREGLLRPSRSDGNTRLYTDEDLERLEFILNLARDLGVNIAGIAIVLQMRERMEEMNRQMQGFVDYVRTEMLSRMQGYGQAQEAGLVPVGRPMVVPPPVKVSATARTMVERVSASAKPAGERAGAGKVAAAKKRAGR
jgi:MerR family transcriptional regulator/heat shock protein HspR